MSFCSKDRTKSTSNHSDNHGDDSLIACFKPNGWTDFYPTTSDPLRLLSRIRRLFQYLAAHPQALSYHVGRAGRMLCCLASETTANGCFHLSIGFDADGRWSLSTDALDRKRLCTRFRNDLEFLLRNPEALPHACDVHGAFGMDHN